jgi:secondary thiamine-phosphate synthase enzyme
MEDGSMQTLARSSIFRHTTLRIDTEHPTQFVDVTDQVEALVMGTEIQTGLVNIQTLHTTTAVVVNEHEPLLLADMSDLLERVAPRDASYRHDDVNLRSVNAVVDERSNGHSHCRALLLAPSVCLNVANGRLQLGTWQRVFLAELDGPRNRALSVLVVGDGER